MIFMNVNLYGLTCMQKFEDRLDLIIKKNLILNINFELGFAL
jgi:hypothetical protein